jgi:hypothetical protein
MQDDPPKDLKLKDVRYTDTSKILKKDRNPLEKCRLTHSEFEDINQRLEESSSGPLVLLRDALSSKSNLENLRPKVEQACEKVTLKVNILAHQETKTSTLQPNMITDVYRIEICDIAKKGYLLLKYSRAKNLKVEPSSSYLIDKIKLVINPKGKAVLVSSSLTVMIQYSMFKASDEASVEIDSDNEYEYQDGQNKSEE